MTELRLTTVYDDNVHTYRRVNTIQAAGFRGMRRGKASRRVGLQDQPPELSDPQLCVMAYSQENGNVVEINDGIDPHTNGVESFWSLLKRGIVGVFHRVSAKYLQAYLDELLFRFNNRHNEKIFDAVMQNC
jgi:hypothetical protein